MRNTFFILGRPRSRTAWLANLLTVPRESFCFHEGLMDASMSFIRLREKLSELPDKVVGCTDTSFIHYVDTLLQFFPQARLVFLTENETSWRMFASRHELPSDVVENINTNYHRAKRMLAERAMFVPCEAITSSSSTARAVWMHCTGDIHGWSDERWKMLRDLNVQVKPESLARRIHVPH